MKILLVDGETIFRSLLSSYLKQNNLEVVAEASRPSQAVSMISEVNPTLIIMEVAGMEGISSFEATRVVKKSHSHIQTIFLTRHDDEEYCYDAVEAGADGYVLKSDTTDNLMNAIREVERKGKYFSARITSQILEAWRQLNSGQRQPRIACLTPREREVLKLLAEGNNVVKDIASTLNLSVKTVEVHKYHMMKKLGLHSRTDVVRYAIQNKIIKVRMAAAD